MSHAKRGRRMGKRESEITFFDIGDWEWRLHPCESPRVRAPQLDDGILSAAMKQGSCFATTQTAKSANLASTYVAFNAVDNYFPFTV